MSRITVSRTVGGIVFPGSPLAANKEELEQLAGYWPDIDKSRAEARRLLKEAGAEGLIRTAQSQRRPAVQFNGTWVIDEWRKDRRAGDAACVADEVPIPRRCATAISQWRSAECQNVVNPLLDGTQVAAALGLRRELRQLRRPNGDRHL
jgi:peptide/nickel transport system substrate-binding protein